MSQPTQPPAAAPAHLTPATTTPENTSPAPDSAPAHLTPDNPQAPPPPAFTPPPYSTTPPTPAPLNPLAVAAVLCGILLSPLGIVLGHISLSQIRRTGQQGTGLAIAGLITGYLFTGFGVLALIVSLMMANAMTNAIDDIAAPYSQTTTATTTSPAWYNENPGDPIANIIVTSDVGACLYKEASGSTITTLRRVECSDATANYRVTDRTTSTSYCPTDDWVWAEPNGNRVVLCLTPE